MDINVDLQRFINFLVKKTSVSVIKNTPNKELADELHKPIIKKLNKQKVQIPFIDNIWGADLADMQLIKDLDFYYALLTFIVNIYGLFLSKTKKRNTITNSF